MTSEYEQRKADWAKKIQDQGNAVRQKEIIVGKTSGTVEKDISALQELKVKINEAGSMSLQPSTGLLKGETVTITIMSNPSLSKEPKVVFGREKEIRKDEALGTITGKIKKGNEIKIKIDNINVQKSVSSDELDKGDSIRLIISK